MPAPTVPNAPIAPHTHGGADRDRLFSAHRLEQEIHADRNAHSKTRHPQPYRLAADLLRLAQTDGKIGFEQPAHNQHYPIHTHTYHLIRRFRRAHSTKAATTLLRGARILEHNETASSTGLRNTRAAQKIAN